VVHGKVLKQIENEDLVVFAIWMPVLGSDNAKEGKNAEKPRQVVRSSIGVTPGA
jgi:hypothetical protein